MSTRDLTLHALFAIRDVEPGVARVRSLSVHEGLSEVTLIEVDVDFDEVSVDPKSWVRETATVALVLDRDGSEVRRWSGPVMRVRERASMGAEQRISVVIQSPLALLGLFSDHRIFQEKTTRDIVTQLLEEAAIAADEVEWRLSGDYPTREVCTQYAETHLDFAMRILEEDGIFFFTTTDGAANKIVFADASSAYPSCAPSAEVPFVASSGLVGGESMSRLEEIARVRPAKVTLVDHDFERPALDLLAEAEDDAVLGRELYDHPGRYVEPSEGKRRAQVRLEALAAEHTGLSASGGAPSLAAGHTVEIVGSPAGLFDATWACRSVEHRWAWQAGGGGLETDATLLPKDLPFRPPHRAPPPAVPGPQIARVTGPSGQEIHCDEHGRVKVRFPWDRRASTDDKSSGWVRVSQMHTSGSVAIPRVGWEVLVDFEDGDPDRPIVLGRLYNAQVPPPYALPENKATSSFQSASSPGMGGFNEIRLKDDAGSEHVHIHAEKDLNIDVAGNATLEVANTSSTNIGAVHTVDVGASDTLTVAGAHSLIVAADQSRSIGSSRTETVSGDESINVKASRSVTIGGGHTRMTPMSDSTSTAGSLTETVAGSCIEAAALSVEQAVGGAVSVTVGGAKIEAVAAGKTDTTIGAKATTVGGAFVSSSGADVGIGVKGPKATTVGGAYAVQAGGDFNLTAGGSLKITVGGAVAMNATKVVLKVGGSNVTVSAGGVVLKSSTIKITASGPQPELGAAVSDK